MECPVFLTFFWDNLPFLCLFLVFSFLVSFCFFLCVLFSYLLVLLSFLVFLLVSFLAFALLPFLFLYLSCIFLFQKLLPFSPLSLFTLAFPSYYPISVVSYFFLSPYFPLPIASSTFSSNRFNPFFFLHSYTFIPLPFYLSSPSFLPRLLLYSLFSLLLTLPSLPLPLSLAFIIPLPHLLSPFLNPHPVDKA